MPDDLAGSMTETPYARFLGVRCGPGSGGQVRLVLPYSDRNANPGGILHGGVVASLAGMAGTLAARNDRLLELGIVYLAPAASVEVIAEARTLRRGKAIAFFETEVSTRDGTRVARALLTVRLGASGQTLAQRRTAAVPPPATAELPSFARLFTAGPFMARLGIAPRRAEDGVAVVALPWQPALADAAGRIHDGAVAALADTTAAMAAWSCVPFDPRNLASTIGLHVSHIERPAGTTVVAEARVLGRNDDIFSVQVTLTANDAVIALAEATYRILVAAGP